MVSGYSIRHCVNRLYVGAILSTRRTLMTAAEKIHKDLTVLKIMVAIAIFGAWLILLKV
jgi:hypothetical protein